MVWEPNIPRNKDRNVVSVANFEAWRDRNQVFDGMAALVPRPVTLVDGDVPDLARAAAAADQGAVDEQAAPDAVVELERHAVVAAAPRAPDVLAEGC